MNSEELQETAAIGAALLIGIFAATANGFVGDIVFLMGLGLFAFGLAMLTLGRIKQRDSVAEAPSSQDRDRKP